MDWSLIILCLRMVGSLIDDLKIELVTEFYLGLVDLGVAVLLDIGRVEKEGPRGEAKGGVIKNPVA